MNSDRGGVLAPEADAPLRSQRLVSDVTLFGPDQDQVADIARVPLKHVASSHLSLPTERFSGPAWAHGWFTFSSSAPPAAVVTSLPTAGINVQYESEYERQQTA